MIRILFVCLGNICRSPLAEGLMQHKITERGLDSLIKVDSCGTSDYHIGELPDERTLRNAKENGISLKHRGRQFSIDDFRHFDKILVMDSSNKQNVLRLARSKEEVEKVKLLRSYEPDIKSRHQDVPDPFYGGEQSFQEVYDILNRTTDQLLMEIHGKIPG
ncbi:low molecular weight phosphotyrosine protein phosphatase [Marivirga sp. S37H4]|uniref:protein-tyrosine-phosphatase n=1 Tax=Marivirga aurantiaca TaxID=2802615 RepID=A0A934WVR8_9BACT|nr:low molecular weight protein-tyrosine-phosphatase [Marivirga aurantiaca]MBK6263820.1 low molecular weight phosphotyrosine protein phosphatase [Marivirga aurantiaca]